MKKRLDGLREFVLAADRRQSFLRRTSAASQPLDLVPSLLCSSGFGSEAGLWSVWT